MGIISRFKQGNITCSRNSKKLIEAWINNVGYEFNDFLKFLKLVRVNNPVILSNANLEENTLDCVSYEDKEKKKYSIRLSFYRTYDSPSEIQITQGIVTRTYYVYKNTKSLPIPIPSVEYQSSKLEENGKELYSSYRTTLAYLVTNTLYFSDDCKLNVECSLHEKLNPGFEKNIKIEEYLFGLTPDLKVDEVYKKLLSLLEIQEKDIKNHDRIIITFKSPEGYSEEHKSQNGYLIE